MSDQSDGISEFVGAALRTALTVGIGAVHYTARLRVQQARVREAALGEERRRLQAELEVQRTDAHAKLGAADRPGWIDEATPEEIADLWHTAVAWRNAGDKRAAEVADRIKREVQKKYGVDLEDHQVPPDAVQANLESAARLLDIERPDWFEKATPAEIADWLQTAREWRDQGDARAGAAVERIRRQVLDKFGIDVDDPLVHRDVLCETLEAAARDAGLSPEVSADAEADPKPPLLAAQDAMYENVPDDLPPEPPDEGVPPDPETVTTASPAASASAQAAANRQRLRDYEATFNYAEQRGENLTSLPLDPETGEAWTAAVGQQAGHPSGAVAAAVAGDAARAAHAARVAAEISHIKSGLDIQW